MAISKLHFSAISCYPYCLRRRDDSFRLENKSFNNASRFTRSLNPENSRSGSAYDGSTRVHVVAPPSSLCRDSSLLLEEVGLNSVNGFGDEYGFHSQKKFEKLVVAVDIDEVLGSFLNAMNRFIASHYGLDHEVSEYYVYEFFRVWNCSRAEADTRVHEFYKSHYFRLGVDPIPGAQSVLRNLSSFCKLSIVTSRQNVIKGHTHEWVGKHYPGVFQEVQFGNHFALSGISRPKSEICRSLGAQVLIDDNPRYALECAEAGIRVLLFNYRNSYPWCKDGYADSHKLVTKVYSWEEVEEHLISLATVWN